MREHKIVILGSMGAGKSTAIRTVADGAVVSTDVANTDQERSAKATTTVAMDYGDIRLPGGDRLRLYGTPGQERFEFVWPVVSFGAVGAIVLVDAAGTDPLGSFDRYLNVIRRDNATLPVVVAVTRLDIAEPAAFDELIESAQAAGMTMPMIPVDARSRDSVLSLLDILMSEIDAQLICAEEVGA